MRDDIEPASKRQREAFNSLFRAPGEELSAEQKDYDREKGRPKESLGWMRTER
jgi:hypothetical protein